MLPATRNMILDCCQGISKCRSSDAAGSSVAAAELASVWVVLPCKEAVGPVDAFKKCTLESLDLLEKCGLYLFLKLREFCILVTCDLVA